MTEMTEMTETAPLTATPKRKRGDPISEEHLSISSTPRTVFSFQLPDMRPVTRSAGSVEDGNGSSWSGVARGLKDLSIREKSEGPAGNGSEAERVGGATETAGASHWIEHRESGYIPDATRFDFDASAATSAEEDMQLDPTNIDTTAPRKRAKTFEHDISRPGETAADPATKETGVLASRALSLSLDKPKPRTRSRAGTPPLSSKRKGKAKSAKQEQGEEPPGIVDPIRAALTWQEDEITVYDPEDKDDDGTGINGIGFKPTAAVAYQRAQKRRQQLIDYKKREESEARARRNQRRREQLDDNGGPGMVRRHSIVRVHFSDTPPTTVMTT
ncbi:hypothetical protein F4861DRAFT_382582 [Xylaria intraflava]|nr:hypothetical protein F4861DRAFT_382582 [Xylaria intraflava]